MISMYPKGGFNVLNDEHGDKSFYEKFISECDL